MTFYELMTIAGWCLVVSAFCETTQAGLAFTQAVIAVLGDHFRGDGGITLTEGGE